jgi:hypothetical protein
MFSRPQQTIIDALKPFDGDLFQREKLAQGLVKLLKVTQGPLTIALTAAFGGGKSYFLTRCKHMLEASGVPGQFPPHFSP